MLLLFLFCEWCGRGEARRGEAKRSELSYSNLPLAVVYDDTFWKNVLLSRSAVWERHLHRWGRFLFYFFIFLCFTSFLYFLNQLKKVPTCLEPVYDRDCWLEMDGKRTKPEPEGERALKRILDPSLFVCLSVLSSVRPSVPFDLADDLIFKPIFKSCDCRWLSTSYCCNIWLLSTICCCMYLSAGRATSENRSI